MPNWSMGFCADVLLSGLGASHQVKRHCFARLWQIGVQQACMSLILIHPAVFLQKIGLLLAMVILHQHQLPALLLPKESFGLFAT
ncbi:MAG: hypothetical protein DKT66_16095 [Candidatus Melainabacteria bacterium]|nr:MAG: hypothetical protein DKT66_16095 [Candidatus Melainabacteria bacterium]